MTNQAMDESTLKAAAQIEKLMRLAGNNDNEHQAAEALKKAQALMLAYNLDVAVIEQMSGASAKRADDMVRGGQHKYQRALWGHIARLNFCMHWTQKNRAGRPGGPPIRYKGHLFVHEHRLVGREVNVVASKNMAIYICGTIDRLCEERFLTTNYFALTSSDAIAYREGIADRIIEKIEERRKVQIDEEKRAARKAAKEAAEKGLSTATAVTIGSVAEAEKIANYDFIHGDGAWARKLAREAEREKRWAEEAEEQAKAEREADALYTQWAKANPKEAAALEKKELSRQRARDRAAENRVYRPRYARETKEEERRSSGTYRAGYEKGGEVSLEEQVDRGNQKRIAR